MNTKELPEPECELGYTEEQIKSIVDNYDDFLNWIRGQTGGLCGAEYTDCNEAHGGTVYQHDLERYIQ